MFACADTSPTAARRRPAGILPLEMPVPFRWRTPSGSDPLPHHPPGCSVLGQHQEDVPEMGAPATSRECTDRERPQYRRAESSIIPFVGLRGRESWPSRCCVASNGRHISQVPMLSCCAILRRSVWSMLFIEGWILLCAWIVNKVHMDMTWRCDGLQCWLQDALVFK